MSSAAKVKGIRFESLLVKVLGHFFGGRHGLAPRRVAQAGFEDLGDVHGISPFVGQAKAYASLTDALRIGVPAAVIQAGRAGEDYGVALVKRPRAAAGDCYAVLRLQDFARVLLRLRRAEEFLAQLSEYAAIDHRERTLAELVEPFPRGTE